jgi:hypothetical protein
MAPIILGDDFMSLQVPALRRSKGLLVWAGLQSAIGLPAPLRAQDSPGIRLEGISNGATLDRFTYEGSSGETAFTYRLTGLRPGTLGPELGVSLFPKALAARILVWATDVGAAYNISVPGVTVLIKGGGSALTGLSSDVFFLPGVHLGAGAIIRLDKRTGLRLDAIRHLYFEDGETEPIWSIGLGFCSLPRLREHGGTEASH